MTEWTTFECGQCDWTERNNFGIFRHRCRNCGWVPDQETLPGQAPVLDEIIPNGNAADPVRQPSHYTAGGIETIDYIAAKLGGDALAGYLLGNCIKYLSRAGKKNDALEDYKKAQVYLGWLVHYIEHGRIK